MKTKFMGVAAALIAALALVFGVAAPGALPSLPVATAQAQETPIPAIPAKQDFSNLNANPDPTFEFTVGADATVTSLEFSVSGKNWVQGYKLEINGTSIPPQFSTSDRTRQNFTIAHNGLNISVKKGNVVRLTPDFTAPKVTGSVSVALKGTTPTTTEPDPTEPQPQPSPEPNPDTSVTPAEPTAVDPATADSCVEKGYIDIPDTKGVDYLISGELKSAGQYFYEVQKATVKVTAKPQTGYQFAAGAKTEWSFAFSGKVKTCSTDQPTLPDDTTRAFKATGHGFALQGDPVDPTKPNSFTAKVSEDAKLNYITVRIKTDASALDWQNYQLTVDKVEDGVTLQKRNVNIGNGFITMEVVPVKDGKQVDSAVIPKDAVLTFTNNLAQNKHLSVELDAYGSKKASTEEPPVFSPPDGADWVHGRVPNPPMPKRCGLRIAIVADLSTSLKYADSDGFDESKKAANALIDSLAGTPAKLGIYNFAGRAPRAANGSTYGQNPPYISLQSEQGVNWAKSIVANWQGDGPTNWEAGLKQVAAGNYDVVYFITDGMPTLSSSFDRPKNAGGFVQASALNDAIKAANELKASGTRVVPIMVDLTLGGEKRSRYTVTEDYVLKDVREWQRRDEPQEPGLYYRIEKSPDKARYIGSKDITANFKWAFEGKRLQILEKAPGSTSSRTINRDMNKWTYGTRAVKTMGEDISGTGDTIRVEQYSQLAAQMKQIGEELASRCNGVVKVKKRIVDENGNVLEDGAPGWEFTLSAGGQDIIDPGNGDRVRKSLKTTSSANEDRGTASWNIMSEQEQQLTLVETQQPGFNLYKRNDKNAECTETRDGKTNPIDVINDGEFGFKVKMSEKDKKLSSVFCVVDNYKQPETPPGKLTFKKAQYDGDKIVEIPGLGGATFKIYPSKGGQPDYSAGELYTIEPGNESIEVKTTGTFFLVETKAPKGLNLLAQPVEFQISVDEKTKKYKISAVSTSSGQIQVSGDGDKMILQVADTTAGKLPKTGGYGVGLVGLIGAALAGAGLLLGRRKTA
ncbi:VWA domain-containing protein [Corynebacterium diphtheriae]|nr:VWA domain-containing protein [Corynebacterium diphtheriae]